MNDVDDESPESHATRASGGVAAGADDLLGELERLTSTDVVESRPGRQAGPARYGDAVVRAVAGWYLRYLGQHAAALGSATVELGRALTGRAEAVEAATGALSGEVDELRARVERLEAR